MLPQLSSKLIFHRLLNSVTRNTVFSFNGKLYRQTDGCGMGNPLSLSLSLKDKNLHKSHVIYEGECSCGENYVGETMRSFEVRITEHSNICHTLEPARHLLENPSHSFQWRVLCSARYYFKRKIIEGLIIQQRSPTLNKQVNC